jgi:hypothetical protein
VGENYLSAILSPTMQTQVESKTMCSIIVRLYSTFKHQEEHVLRNSKRMKGGKRFISETTLGTR